MVKFILIILIRLYQLMVSPLLGPSCRFSVSCSQNMLSSINDFGVVLGLYFGLTRILSCNPWYNKKGVCYNE